MLFTLSPQTWDQVNLKNHCTETKLPNMKPALEKNWRKNTRYIESATFLSYLLTLSISERRFGRMIEQSADSKLGQICPENHRYQRTQSPAGH